MPGGRKSAYDEIIEPNLIRIEGWCRDGLNDKQICKNLDISQETFYKYKREKPEFNEILQRTKDVVDREVENALYKRAMGFDYVEETKEMRTLEGAGSKDGKARESKAAVIKKTTKHYPPDTTACIFWLKNRKPREYRDRRSVELTGQDGGPIQTQNETKLDLSKLTDEQLDALDIIIATGADEDEDKTSDGNDE